MSTADIGIYGEELYEQVLPLHGPDPDGLARDYVGAVTSQAIEIDELARDDAYGRPGWGAILDVDDCPIKGLPWLAQIAGVGLRDLKVITDGQNLMPRPSFEADDDVTGWTVTTVGPALLQQQGGPEASNGEWFGQFVMDGDATAVAMFDTVIAALPAHQYTLSLDLVGRGDPTVTIDLVMEFYDGVSLLDTATVEATALGRASLTASAPGDADGLKIGFGAHDLSGNPSLDYAYVDAIRVDEGTSDYYLDGNVEGGSWTGAAHKSASLVRHLETEEEWAIYARDAIRRQGGKGRGTADAILSAAEDTLTGTKAGRILERVGGNAYALELVTRPSETPDAAATLAAAMSQKPAGMSLVHTLTESVIINEGTRSIDTSTGTIDAATAADVID